MNDAEASAAAETFARASIPELADRTWRVTAFDGCWLATPEGDDLRWRTGLVSLVVLPDGTVHRESSSVPPLTLVEKYGSSANTEDDVR